MNCRLSSSLPIFLGLFVIAASGCSKSDQPEVSSATPQPSAGASASQPSASSPSTAQPAGDGSFACTLLTKEETQAVQGEPFKDAKASVKTSAGMTFAQCYYELPTVVNSIVLTVTQRAEGADARDPKQNWQEIFRRDKSGEKKEKEKEKEGSEPEKIEGLGDEAFWTGTRVGGALYVLKGNSFIRISVGGGGDRGEKVEKSKALAQSVLKRL